MHTFTTQYGIEIFFLVLIVRYALWPYLYKEFFRPYRNTFMVWYMKTFDAHYKMSKKSFDFFIKKHLEYKWFNEDKSSYVFFTFLQENRALFPFREEGVKIETAMAQYGIDQSIDDMLEQCINTYTSEIFVQHYGRGISYHKVRIQFTIQHGIMLKSIKLIYMEERYKHPFYYVIEEKIFDDDVGGRKKSSALYPFKPGSKSPKFALS